METHEEFQSSLRARCRAARLAVGASFREAERLTGVPFNTISRIENANMEPSSAVLWKMAVGYGVPLESLLCGNPPIAKPVEEVKPEPVAPVEPPRAMGKRK